MNFAEKILNIQSVILGVCTLLAYGSILLVDALGGTSNSWILASYDAPLSYSLLVFGAVIGLGILVSMFLNRRKLILVSFFLASTFHMALAGANIWVFHGQGAQMFLLIFISLFTGLRFAYFSLEARSTARAGKTML